MRILCIIFFIALTGRIPAQTFEWARTGSGVGQDAAQRVVADEFGNIYVTGYFSGRAVFSGQTYIGKGAFDIFLAKYSGSGDLVWLKSAGSSQNDVSYGLAIDTFGNIYVTGYFTSSATFGEAGNTTTLSSSGNNDIFLAKYDSDGNFVWAKKAGGPGEDRAQNLTIDIYNNIYLTGYFEERCTFGSQTATSQGSTDAFIAQYDTAGNCHWVHSLGSSGLDKSFGVTVDSSGNSYITGFFYYAAILSNSTDTLLGDGLSSDIFICKYNPSGDVLLAERVGGYYNDAAFGIAVDKDKAIFVTGYFLEEIHFGGDCYLQNYRYNDVFVVKFDSLFNCEWANHEGGNHLDMGLDIVTDRHGNVYTTGMYDSLGIFGTDSIFGAGYYDMFICKYNNKGNLLWTQTAGGKGGDFSKSVCVRSDGVIYLAGYYKVICSFGSIQAPQSQENDIFVTKMGQPVGVEESTTSSRKEFNIFPNPSDGRFFIDAGNWNEARVSITLMDITGKIILQQTNRTRKLIQVELRQPPGIYVMKLQTGSNSFAKRLVVF